MEGLTETVIGKRKAVFDTGTSAIVGDPAGIKEFYKQVHGAKPMMNGRRYLSTWTVLLIDTARRLISYVYHSPMRLQHFHLGLCWKEGSQDFSRFIQTWPL